MREKHQRGPGASRRFPSLAWEDARVGTVWGHSSIWTQLLLDLLPALLR